MVDGPVSPAPAFAGRKALGVKPPLEFEEAPIAARVLKRKRTGKPHPVMAGINDESDDDDDPGLQAARRLSAAERARQEAERAADSD
jgi:hypothetical protein